MLGVNSFFFISTFSRDVLICEHKNDQSYTFKRTLCRDGKSGHVISSALCDRCHEFASRWTVVFVSRQNGVQDWKRPTV